MAVKNATKALSREERLARLKKKMESVDLGGGKGFWSPKQGRNIIRIMPPVREMEYYFQEVGKHSMSPDGKKRVYCPSFTSGGQLPCPVCEIIKDLRDAGDKASAEMAKSLGNRRMFWMNVIDRENPAAGPLIYTPGVMVFGDVTAYILDPDYGDIYDVEDGIDMVITREGSGINTEYNVKARKNASPLSEDPDEIEKWLDAALDLSYTVVDDDPENDKALSRGHAIYLLPYSRIVKEFNLDDIAADDLGVEEEEEEVVTPKKSPAKKHAAPVIDVEEEDDDDEDDEEEDEDIPAAKQEVSRRQARRSRR